MAGAQVPAVFASVRYIIGRYGCRCIPLDNALDPNLMTAAERIRGIGEILAAGILRLRARESARAASDRGDLSLDFPATRRVHGRKRETIERP